VLAGVAPADKHRLLAPGLVADRIYTDIMGWWPFSPSEQDGPKKTTGGAFEQPSRSTRAKCYEARDAFFECLDRNNILDSINTKDGRDAAKKACSQEDVVFEKDCAHSWVCLR
jgi:cytochrome c oxidase assembly factor 6